MRSHENPARDRYGTCPLAVLPWQHPHTARGIEMRALRFLKPPLFLGISPREREGATPPPPPDVPTHMHIAGLGVVLLVARRAHLFAKHQLAKQAATPQGIAQTYRGQGAHKEISLPAAGVLLHRPTPRPPPASQRPWPCPPATPGPPQTQARRHGDGAYAAVRVPAVRTAAAGWD